MPQRMYETCTVPGCTRKHKAAGYCATHYAQHFRGKPLVPIRARERNHAPTCSEPECAAPVKAKGLCKMHYARLLRHGFTRNPDRKKPFQPCLIEGCDCNRYAGGLCNQHYQRERDAAVYGMTLSDLAQVLLSQGSVCAICGQPPEAVNGKSGKVVDFHMDHDHATGKFRGLLCAHCNRAIGLLNDSPDTLRRAAAYLESHAALAATSLKEPPNECR